MLILLTHANHLYSDRKQQEKMQPYPPLQTLIAAALLRENGFEVAFADVTFERDITAVLDRVRPDMIAVCEDNFNYLTKMCLMQNRTLAFEMAALAKARGIIAVVNSSDANDHATAYLDAGFDCVIQGELESTLLDVCKRWPAAVAGTVYREQDTSEARYTAPRAPIESLDSLPLPAWDLLDIRPYREAWLGAHGFFSMNLVTSRGCPYHCNWCAKPIYGSSYRFLSAHRAARELAEVERRFHPDQVWFADDIFGLSQKWTREFALEVERLGVTLPFKIQSRCDLMTRDTVEYLARAGCNEVWMGAESGSQKVLDAMEKGIRVEQVYQARKHLRNHGIRACLFLQFGYLGEEWDDIEQTIRMVRETHPDDIGISVSYPLPKTRFHEIVNAQIGRKSNWSDSGDLAMMFRGAFSTDFYRALSRALHLEVREQPAADAITRAWEEVEQLRCVCC